MTGISELPELPAFLMDHQRDITNWALRRGRAAIFADTGLGKTAMELAWADAVRKHTQKPVLIFAPLTVAHQHVREAEKFNFDGVLFSDGSIVYDVTTSNYHKLHLFDTSQFGGVVIDESSILKNETGKFRNDLIKSFSQTPFRLAATATPSPNDFMELGNHSEFLGVMSYTDMLATFFVHDGGETQKWRLKGHAENVFWEWVSSWAVMIKKPSDLGYSDAGYDLPPLNQTQHTVKVNRGPSCETGSLFTMEAKTLRERLQARRESVDERCALAAEITPNDRPFVWWCNLNAESEKLAKMIPDAVELRGSQSDEKKEQVINDFLAGKIRVLVTKASIAGFGLNFQHCADTGFVGLSDSFEQVYQAIRRFWRFGQTKPVNVHFIAAETEGAVVENIKRKEADAEKMSRAMLMYTKDITKKNVRGLTRDKGEYNPTQNVIVPDYLKTAEWV